MTTTNLVLSSKMRRQAQSSQSNIRVNGVAGALATLVFLFSLIGTIWMSETGVNDILIGGYFIITELVAFYILLG
ncbi:MAG: hypothetical protein HC806_01985 [Anaerolineae bacterium]|nr:hypothetical protein [Anaerolineae bacterium]